MPVRPSFPVMLLAAWRYANGELRWMVLGFIALGLSLDCAFRGDVLFLPWLVVGWLINIRWHTVGAPNFETNWQREYQARHGDDA